MLDDFIIKLVMSYVAVIIFVLFMCFLFEGDKIMEEEKKKPILAVNERYCEKCQRVVHYQEYNGYFKICDACVKKGGRL